MILHKESHADHVPPEVLEWVLHRFRDKDAFFMETVEIPAGLPQIECGLHGPVMGDAPVAEEEVTYRAREGRSWASRLVGRSKRPTRQITVIAGPFEEHQCALYTTFAGPLAPKETQDPTLDPSKQRESQEFWSEHALSL